MKTQTPLPGKHTRWLEPLAMQMWLIGSVNGPHASTAATAAAALNPSIVSRGPRRSHCTGAFGGKKCGSAERALGVVPRWETAVGT